MFDEIKFRELILYIADKCSDDRLWGATKLNKQLFFCDFLAYKHIGHSITGADYIALEYGPGPRLMLPIREQMVEHRDIELIRIGSQHRIVPLRQVNARLFSLEELRIIDDVIGQLRDSTADEVSDLSHHFLGWRAARAEAEMTGESVSIPYETVFVQTATPTKQEIEQVLASIGDYGWPE